MMVFGVLNVTPDSFSDGGQYLDQAAAVARARELVAQGADVIDVGGESTRPGAERVSAAVEQQRVIPVITALVDAGIAVSIDTLRAETAAAAVAAGARWVNDVSGGLADPAMYKTVAQLASENEVFYILGHWRGIPDPAHSRSVYGDVVADVCAALAEQAKVAAAAGIDPARIILDPGLGFDKTAAQSWELLANLDVLNTLGYPVLIGASRKRMLVEALGNLPGGEISTADRDLATAVVSALLASTNNLSQFAVDRAATQQKAVVRQGLSAQPGAGAWGVRVHDVASTIKALAIAKEFAAAKKPETTYERSHFAANNDSRSSENRDRITLSGLAVFAHHGVFEFEREQGQRFVIDAEVHLDTRRAAGNDALENTVNYAELAAALQLAAAHDPVDLIETLAERLAAVALSFAGVEQATITVHKPDAPIDAEFSDVAVTVVRP